MQQFLIRTQENLEILDLAINEAGGLIGVSLPPETKAASLINRNEETITWNNGGCLETNIDSNS